MSDNLVGVILAGGQSTRMNGKEKSLLPFGHSTLLAHIQKRFEQQVAPVALNANGDPRRFDTFGLEIIPDTLDGHQGPLAGVLAAMRWAKRETKARKIITAAVDTPFFPKDYVSRMVVAGQDHQIGLAGSQGRKHPVFGLWDIDLADKLENCLLGGDRKVMIFVQQFSNTVVDFPIHEFDPFFNVNTPDELEMARQLIGTEQS